MPKGVLDVLKIKEYEMEPYPGQYLRDIAVKDDGFGIGLHYVRLAKGASLPEHEHEGVEVIYVLSGKARAVMGKKKTPVGADMAIVVPKGIKHYLVNTGKDDLIVLAFFCPPLL